MFSLVVEFRNPLSWDRDISTITRFNKARKEYLLESLNETKLVNHMALIWFRR